MWETPAVKPHEAPLAVMAAAIVPFDGGEAMLRAADPDSLRAPFTLSHPDVITRGQTAYGYYCIQCHGKYHDGNGTVGQEFRPPAGGSAQCPDSGYGPRTAFFMRSAMASPAVVSRPLATTMSVAERWQAVGYVKSLGRRP